MSKAEVVKGKLSEIEQWAILGMQAGRMEAADMKKVLNRSSKSRVVEEFLSKHPTQTNTKALGDRTVEDEWEETKHAVINQFRQEGMPYSDAAKIVAKAMANMDLGNTTPEIAELRKAALQAMGPSEMMIKESAGGRKGVSIMTESAAQSSDHKMQEVNSRPKHKVLAENTFVIHPQDS